MDNRFSKMLPLLAASGALVSLCILPAAALPPAPVISEVLYDGTGADGDDVFTEITGPPGLSLDGWSLTGVNGDSGDIYRTVDLSGWSLPMDGILVIATAAAAPALAAERDLIASVDWQNGPDAVQLRDNAGRVVDAVQYGAAEFPGGEGDPAADVDPGQSLTRDSTATDTQDNSRDFASSDHPTPGRAAAEELPPESSPLLSLALPDTFCLPSDTLEIPLRYTAANAAGIIALDLDLVYGNSLLLDAAALPAPDNGPGIWSLASQAHPGPPGTCDTLKISLATATDTLVGSGDLLMLSLVVANRSAYAWSPLTLDIVAVNAASGAGTSQPGRLALRGHDAQLAAMITPADSLWASVRDSDADQDPGVVDSLALQLHVGSRLDTLIATETAPHSGTFIFTAPTTRSAPGPGDTRVELPPDSSLSIVYIDALTADGPPVQRTATLRRWAAADARLSATRVVQPGDVLRVYLVDADADIRTDAIDTVWVRVETPGLRDMELLPVLERTLSDSVFLAQLRTGAADTLVHNGVIGVQAGDMVRLSHIDSMTVSGVPLPCSTAVAVVPLFGDVDGNGVIQAFDAARVLAHVLAPMVSLAGSLAANVDSLAPDGAITPYDAALILERRVGRRSAFPVQGQCSRNQPGWQPAARPLRTHLAWQLEAQADLIVLNLDDRAGLMAGDLFIQGVHGRVRLPDAMQGFLLAQRDEPRGMRIVLAGPQPLFGPGPLLEIQAPQPLPGLRLAIQGTFDDGRMEAGLATVRGEARPLHTTLGRNRPNPFNPSTAIPFQLSVPGWIELSILDILGRPVRTLTSGPRQAGSYQIYWDGIDEHGHPAGTGVYFCRLRAHQSQWMRRLLLLR